jgi:hypothetical protein
MQNVSPKKISHLPKTPSQKRGEQVYAQNQSDKHQRSAISHWASRFQICAAS